MRIFVQYFLLLLFVGGFGSSTTHAQKKKRANFEEGIIKYKIDLEGAPEFSSYLSSAEVMLYLKGKSSKMDISIMGGFAKFQMINNIQQKFNTLLMDIPSVVDKTAIDLENFSDLLKDLGVENQKNKAPASGEVEITYNKRSKKRIAKYPCYQAEMKMKGSNDKVIMYVTDRLRPTAMSEIQKTLGNVTAFPLAFELTIEGVTLKITAVEVFKMKLDTETFTVPKYYTKKSIEDFRKDMEEQFGDEDSVIGL